MKNIVPTTPSMQRTEPRCHRKKNKEKSKPISQAVVVLIFNPSTREGETDLQELVPGQAPKLLRTLAQKNKNKNKQKKGNH